MTRLGSLIIVDRVQPQVAAYMTVASRSGLITRPGNALASFTFMPTVAIEEAMDVGLKRGDIALSFLQMDSRVGFLVLQSKSISEIRDTVDAIVDQLHLEVPPDIVKNAPSRLISSLDSKQAYVTNRSRMGALAISGQSLYVIECDPSAYALSAVNEAEKAADIRLVDFKFTGSMGRVIISGTDSNIRAAREAVAGSYEEAA